MTIARRTVFASAIGLVYYLRIVAVMTAAPANKKSSTCCVPSDTSLAVKGLLAALTIAVLWLGVYPAPLLRIIDGLHLTGL